MEGGGFRYENLRNNPPLYQPSPPLTAIDRFLGGQNHFSYLNKVKNKGTVVSGNGVCDFSAFGGAIGGLPRPSLPIERSFGGGIFINGEAQNWRQERNANVGLRVEAKPVVLKNFRRAGKRLLRSGFIRSKTLIKGQWTEEEDSKLFKLVTQHGVRKWAQIAEKLVGRVGKQCRERWHNHLRPDIKKDNWSEEEEKMLVEAHQEVGNKWAEIAKRIPGRTENSIKNHWNATKRRQNARRKCRKFGQNANSQSTILQDYIRTKILKLDNTSTTITSTITPTISTSTITNTTFYEDPSIKFGLIFPEMSQSTSDDHSPSSLITQTYDEELNFMKTLFGNNSNESFVENPITFNPIVPIEAKTSQNDEMLNGIVDQNMHINNFLNEETPNTPLYSDLYLSYLLDGATTLPSTDFYYGDMQVEMPMNEGSSSGKKDMDLIEMISACQFSQGSNSGSFVI